MELPTGSSGRRRYDPETNLGGVYITVNGYNVRNDDELAQTVADKINGMIHEDDSVFK